METAWLDELSEWLRIPSVSADPAHAADVRRAGEWLRDYVVRAGGEAELRETESQPLVVGELPASNGGADVPTVLVYGHFDVQPPAPLELWESDPFEPTVRDEWLYARGVADDKGQLYAVVNAAAELARDGRLPVNVRIACDGEEEIGGHSIVDWVETDARGADACVIFDGGMERRDMPSVCTGTRGLVAFDLHVRTGRRDLHSGMYGNAALNAIHALMQALTVVLPRDGRLPDALREGIVPPAPEEQESWTLLPRGAEMLAEQGARPYDESAAEEFWLRTTAEPSVDVNGILGGKPGLRNTTVPVAAEANFTIRLAPGQEVERIAAAAERLVREAAPAGADVDLRFAGGTPAAVVSPDEPALRLASDAIERVFARRPLLTRAGGTLPVMAALTRRGIPPILTGVALPDSNVHSPNERLPLDYVPLAIAAAREVLVSLGELR